LLPWDNERCTGQCNLNVHCAEVSIRCAQLWGLQQPLAAIC